MKENLDRKKIKNKKNKKIKKINNWYKKLEQYSLDFVRDVATFCNATITNLTTEIQNTQNVLQQTLEKDAYQEFQNTINTNHTIYDCSLKQRTLKKIN